MSIFVSAPARDPFPYGLFSVIDFGNESHFETGIKWETLGGGGVSGIASWFEACDEGDSPDGLPKGFSEDLNGLLEANGFTVYGGYKCSVIGYDMSHANEMATNALLAREQTRVEQALWTGDLGNTPSFAGSTVASGTFDPREALSEAEKWIQDNYGALGVIHIPRAFIYQFLGYNMVVVRDGHLYTIMGTPVVAGAGYPRTSPVSGAPGLFIVATGAMVGQRSEIFGQGQVVNFGQNDIYGLAERGYSIGFDTEDSLAIPVTLSSDYYG